jgi:para-nitrobenzyl esterase
MNRSLLSLLIGLALTAAASGGIIDPVRVEQGKLSGIAGKSPDVRVYKGIPYAAPPVGDLRWKPPQPPASWQGVREAKDLGNACWQTPYAAGSFYQAKLPPISEDCLFLNVWTAAKSAKDKLPVMVWIHGGGFTRGQGGAANYDGENFARKGVVLVTINYRLGVFGFFAHPALSAESAHHASGNYAILDQIAALKWVKNNIAAFGGDPDKVTIFGESAGSWAVNVLMASPLAKGLFRGVIGESGGQFSPMKSLADAEKAGERFASSLSISTSSTEDALKALRAKPPEELLKASDAPTASPDVDGWVLPEETNAIFAEGKQNDVPLIVGFNADEGTTLAPQLAQTTAAAFAPRIQQLYGSSASEFLKAYPGSSDSEAVTSAYSAYRDQVFGWQMRTWARLATKTGHHPAYLYYFSHHSPGPLGERMRAFHASEISYVFGNFVWPFPWGDADHKFHELMSTYWVNFAKTGDPNSAGLARWPVYNPATDQALEFGEQIGVRSQVNKAGLDFFDGYYQELRAKAASTQGTSAANK